MEFRNFLNKVTKLTESTQLNEKWGEKTEVKPSKKGMWDDWTLVDLRKERTRLKKKEKRTTAESTKLKEINFAIRAKTGWGKVSESLSWKNKTFNIKGVGITSGTGLWSKKKAKVPFNLKFGYVDLNEYYCEFKAFFSSEYWNVEYDGLIYTDPKFLKGVEDALRYAGFKNFNDIDYTEQGMQGDNYVSLQAGDRLIKELIEKIRFSPASFDESANPWKQITSEILSESEEQTKEVLKEGWKTLERKDYKDGATVSLEKNIVNGADKDEFYIFVYEKKSSENPEIEIFAGNNLGVAKEKFNKYIATKKYLKSRTLKESAEDVRYVHTMKNKFLALEEADEEISTIPNKDGQESPFSTVEKSEVPEEIVKTSEESKECDLGDLDKKFDDIKSKLEQIADPEKNSQEVLDEIKEFFDAVKKHMENCK